MKKSFQHNDSLVTVLNDLSKINNERMLCYHQTLGRIAHLDTDLKEMLSDMVIQAKTMQLQLAEMAKCRGLNPNNQVSISGRMHSIWIDLKVAFTGDTRNAVTKYCAYNEKVALQVYNAALSFAIDRDKALLELIKEHLVLLHATESAIHLCATRPSFTHSRLVYFN